MLIGHREQKYHRRRRSPPGDRSANRRKARFELHHLLQREQRRREKDLDLQILVSKPILCIRSSRGTCPNGVSADSAPTISPLNPLQYSNESYHPARVYQSREQRPRNIRTKGR